MTVRNGAATAACLAALLASRAAAADSLLENLGPRSIGMGETMRGSAHGGLATYLNPSGLPISNDLVFDGSYGFRPEDGSSRASASACDSTVPVPGCFYYQYLEADPEVADNELSRRSHEFGLVIARAITDLVYAGVNVKYFDYNTELAGEQDAAGFAADAGITVRAGQYVNLGVVGYNVVAEQTRQYPRGVGGGLAVKPLGALTVALDGVWNIESDDAGAGRYGLGAEYFLSTEDQQSGIPLRLGGVYDAQRDGGFVTAGAGYVTSRVGIDIAGRAQVSGGDAFTILGSLRLFGPQVR